MVSAHRRLRTSPKPKKHLTIGKLDVVARVYAYKYNLSMHALGLGRHEHLVEAVQPGDRHLDVQHQDLQRQRHAAVHLHGDALLVGPEQKYWFVYSKSKKVRIAL